MRSRPVRLVAGLAVVAALALSPAATIAQSPAASSGAPVTIVDADGNEVQVTDASKVVTLGGVITETAFALGAGDQIVGVDASSYYPYDQAPTKAMLPTTG